jgi:hypothetical protein
MSCSALQAPEPLLFRIGLGGTPEHPERAGGKADRLGVLRAPRRPRGPRE